MKIKTISVQRIKNLGNYQSEKLEMFAELEETDDPDTAVINLRKKVKMLLNGTLPDEQITTVLSNNKRGNNLLIVTH